MSASATSGIYVSYTKTKIGKFNTDTLKKIIDNFNKLYGTNGDYNVLSSNAQIVDLLVKMNKSQLKLKEKDAFKLDIRLFNGIQPGEAGTGKGMTESQRQELEIVMGKINNEIAELQKKKFDADAEIRTAEEEHTNEHPTMNSKDYKEAIKKRDEAIKRLTEIQNDIMFPTTAPAPAPAPASATASATASAQHNDPNDGIDDELLLFSQMGGATGTGFGTPASTITQTPASTGTSTPAPAPPAPVAPVAPATITPQQKLEAFNKLIAQKEVEKTLYKEKDIKPERKKNVVVEPVKYTESKFEKLFSGKKINFTQKKLNFMNGSDKYDKNKFKIFFD